jgi:hypothetical protein
MPYTRKLVRGEKRYEMRSRSIETYWKVAPGEWLWFSTLKGKVKGCTGCAVLGGARYMRELGPLVPGNESDEKAWAGLPHGVPMSLSEFAKRMPGGYLKGVMAWEFDGAVELDMPVDMADDNSITMARFVPREE